MEQEHEITIPARFCGPPASGNGGYVCGVLASFLGEPARVRLHVPPPLERPLRVLVQPHAAELRDGDVLVASAIAADVPRDAPPAPTLDEARIASTRYIGFAQHPFPRCFVCGPQRAPGDGLRIFPGVSADGLVAAPFVPDPSLLDERGYVRSEHVWAALDCPGYFACVAGADAVPMVLGELSAAVLADVPSDRPLVAYGWALEKDGRKARCGSALASADGELLAVGWATWIKLRAGG